MARADPPRRELKKALYRLAVARSDLLAARLTASQLLDQVHDLSYPDYLGHPLFFPLLHACAISYGRPFSDNRPLGSLPRKFSKFDEHALTEAHELVLDLRNKYVAHSDQLEREVEVIPPGYRLREDMPPTVGVGLSVRQRGISVEQLRNIERVANEVGRRVDDAVREHTKRLYEGRSLPSEPFSLTLDDEL